MALKTITLQDFYDSGAELCITQIPIDDNHLYQPPYTSFPIPAWRKRNMRAGAPEEPGKVGELHIFKAFSRFRVM